jgi:predicted nuclease of predicted toxin-antitoxin system
LLLDENLSERLLPLLIERFPHSTHVRQIGLGNVSNAATASLLLQQAEAIEQFCSHPDAGFLLLQPSTSAT